MTDLKDLLTRVMVALRAHNESKLAYEVGDALLHEAELAAARQDVNLQAVPTMTILAEFCRRHPTHAFIFEHAIEGQPGSAHFRTAHCPNPLLALGLYRYGMIAVEHAILANHRPIPPGQALDVGPVPEGT